MDKLKNILFLLVFLVVTIAEPITACTTFRLKVGNHIVLCKNLDYELDLGLIVINKKGVLKRAFLPDGKNAAEWISKYGSVTFNHLGKEFPLGGMNEAGLAIEEMNYFWTKYPAPDERPCIAEMQWIQYQLDNFSTVEEVIKSDSLIRIIPLFANIHFMVSDKSGNMATIEFIKGKMVYHTGDKIIAPVLTNHSYAESVEALRNYKGFGGDKDIPHEYKSLNNFIKAAAAIQNYADDIPVIDYSFNILSSVANKIDTQWSIVYDQSHAKIFYKTKRYPKIKSIDLQKIDFSCENRSLVIDINNDLENEINSYFLDYSTKLNETHLNKVFIRLKHLGEIDEMPDEDFLKSFAKYPETGKCKQK